MGRPRSFVEADVIAAARDEFWSRGYGATSVEDLTAATGLGKGSLYGAFGDKHTLFLVALDDYVSSALDDIRDQLRDPALPARERLVRHVRSQVARVAADKMHRGCLAAKSAAELRATDAEAAARVERMMRRWRDELIATVEEAQADGDIDPGRDAAALATTLLTFVRGLEALGKARVRPAQLKAAAEEFIALIPRIGE